MRMNTAASPIPDTTGVPPVTLGDLPSVGFGTPESSADVSTLKIKAPGPGTTVFGRYRLVRVLGSGGMGVVWLADDLKLERPVALKFLPSLVGIDPGAVKDLKTETRRGLELSHPNIVRIYDFVDDEDSVAISMEYVEGKTLSELRVSTKAGVFTAQDIAPWLGGVCDALDYAHFQRRLIHRDLKPSNLMLCGTDAIAKITDFGIARSFSDTMSRLSVTPTGPSGTLPYMSPQQAMGERPQPTDDVYSLGATLYELFTGKPPFYRGDISTQIHSKVPPVISERCEELEVTCSESVPPKWEDAIARCLSKDSSLRPQSAGALAAMLGLKSSTIGASLPRSLADAMMATPVKPGGRMMFYIAAAAVVVTGTIAALLFFDQEAPLASSAAARKRPPAITPASAAPASPVASIPTAPAVTSAMPPTVAQIPVSEPPNGFWTMEQMFPVPPQSAYSQNGRRHLLFAVQQALKEKNLYNAAIDGKEGKSTHNAVVLFQSKNGLAPSGLLDGPTLAALSLATEPDMPEWKPPVSGSSAGRRTGSKNESGLLQRLGRLFKRD